MYDGKLIDNLVDTGIRCCYEYRIGLPEDQNGEQCRREAVVSIDGVPLCDRHSTEA